MYDAGGDDTFDTVSGEISGAPSPYWKAVPAPAPFPCRSLRHPFRRPLSCLRPSAMPSTRPSARPSFTLVTTAITLAHELNGRPLHGTRVYPPRRQRLFRPGRVSWGAMTLTLAIHPYCAAMPRHATASSRHTNPHSPRHDTHLHSFQHPSPHHLRCRRRRGSPSRSGGHRDHHGGIDGGGIGSHEPYAKSGVRRPRRAWGRHALNEVDPLSEISRPIHNHHHTSTCSPRSNGLVRAQRSPEPGTLPLTHTPLDSPHAHLTSCI